jgi:hypothetical protein
MFYNLEGKVKCGGNLQPLPFLWKGKVKKQGII